MLMLIIHVNSCFVHLSLREFSYYVGKETEARENYQKPEVESILTENLNTGKTGKLIENEEGKKGSVSAKHYIYFFKAIGFFNITILMIFFLIAEAMKVKGKSSYVYLYNLY